MLQPQYINFETIAFDSEGFISIAQLSGALPFEVRRIFWTYQTPVDISRGRHAHHTTVQVLIAVAGKIEVELTSAFGEKTHFELDSPRRGLLIPPHFWHVMTYSENAVQLVLASSDYDEKDYIRDFTAFQEIWRNKTS